MRRVDRAKITQLSLIKEPERHPNEQPVLDTGLPDSSACPPLFSVCIPTYNRASMLPAAIESVLAQDFDNFELIICDNASTDKTEEVVKDYTDRRLRYVRYDNLVSMYGNHNRCVELALGNWIVFLHSDDRMENLRLAQSMLETLPTGVWACFPYRADNPSYPTYQEWGFLEILELMNGISPSGSVYRKDALQKMGGFAEDNIIADWEILLNMSFHHGLVYSYSSQPFVTRNFHGRNAYLRSIRDGSAHFGKAQCVKRLFGNLEINEFKKIVNIILIKWEVSKITKLYFYLLISGLNGEARYLKLKALACKKFLLFSVSNIYAIIGFFFGPDTFWNIYKKIRCIF